MDTRTELVSKSDRRAEYVLKTTVKTRRATVNDVLCRVYLPRSVTETPFLVFEPTAEQAAVMND